MNERLRFYRDPMLKINQSYQNCQSLCFQLRVILNLLTTEILLTFVVTYWKWTVMQTRTRLVHISYTVSLPNIIKCVNQSEMKMPWTGNRLVCNVRTWPSTEIGNTSKPVSIKWKKIFGKWHNVNKSVHNEML